MIENLNQFLGKSSCYCLNEDLTHNHKNLFESSGNVLKSNADEQLLLHLSFIQTVNLHSLKIIVPDNNSSPFTIKLFTNKPSLGFSEAEGKIIAS